MDVAEYKSLVPKKEERTAPIKSEDGKVSAKVGNYTISFGTDHEIPNVEEPVLVSESRRKEDRMKKSVRRKAKHMPESDSADVDDVSLVLSLCILCRCVISTLVFLRSNNLDLRCVYTFVSTAFSGQL